MSVASEVLRWTGPAPPGWRAVRAKFVMREVDERSQDGSEPLLSLSKQHGVVPRSTFGDPTGRADSLVGYKRVEVGQIVSNKMQAWNGLFGLAEIAGVISPDYAVYDVLAGSDARFIVRQLRTPLYAQQFLWRSRGMGTAFLRLHPEALLDTPLLLPPALEQRAIADYLDAETARIDALIAKKRRLIAAVKERFERTVHRDVEALVTEVGSTRLKRLAAISVGIVITPAAWYSEVGGVPALRGMNVRPRRLLVDDLVSLSEAGHLANKKSELRAGDVVVVRTGQAGAAAVVPPSLDGCNCIDLLIVRRSPDLDPEFLSFVLNSEWVSKQIAEFSVGAIQSHFNVGALKELIVPPVRPEDQRGVAARWEALEHHSDAVTERLNRQIELLLEHRQALITAAVTGQSEVPGVAA